MLYEKRELIGKLFFGISILILIYMFISPLTHTILHIDEYWTYSLVNLTFMQGMTVAVHDVHPILYYLILYLFKPIAGSDNFYFFKVLSIVPYLLLLVVSATKIKDDHGWLTAGLFTFSLGVMSDFFIEFSSLSLITVYCRVSPCTGHTAPLLSRPQRTPAPPQARSRRRLQTAALRRCTRPPRRTRGFRRI